MPAAFASMGLTYDDVLLLPGYSDLAPNDIDTTTRLTRVRTSPCQPVESGNEPRIV